MKLQLLLFGVTADLLKTSSLEIEVLEKSSIKDLKRKLIDEYPQLQNINSYAIAVNESYANDEIVLQKSDIVAIIPPVSGG